MGRIELLKLCVTYILIPLSVYFIGSYFGSSQTKTELLTSQKNDWVNGYEAGKNTCRDCEACSKIKDFPEEQRIIYSEAGKTLCIALDGVWLDVRAAFPNKK